VAQIVLYYSILSYPIDIRILIYLAAYPGNDLKKIMLPEEEEVS